MLYQTNFNWWVFNDGLGPSTKLSVSLDLEKLIIGQWSWDIGTDSLTIFVSNYSFALS